MKNEELKKALEIKMLESTLRDLEYQILREINDADDNELIKHFRERTKHLDDKYVTIKLEIEKLKE